MAQVVPSLAGHRRPQDRIPLDSMQQEFRQVLSKSFEVANIRSQQVAGAGEQKLRDGDVVIAAITSCTNTSNPSVMVAAGMLARNAVARGLRVRSWVKDLPGPWLPGRGGVFGGGGIIGTAPAVWLSYRWPWLYHLHRQLRSASRGHFQCYREGGFGGVLGTLWQSQF